MVAIEQVLSAEECSRTCTAPFPLGRGKSSECPAWGKVAELMGQKAGMVNSAGFHPRWQEKWEIEHLYWTVDAGEALVQSVA